jgi:hypothetical protein
MSSQAVQIYDVFNEYPKAGVSFKTRHRGRFGVEIETETEKKYEFPSLKLWDTTKDNSLRDWGVEYVLRSPMDMPEFEKALEEFAIVEKKYKFKKSSISTSVHVHINFLNETFLTLANFFTAYALVENLLIRYSGPDRLSNLFCLPMIDCEGVSDNLYTILSNVARNNFRGAVLQVDRVKYGAINAAPLTKLGTIEIRCFRGETDIKIIRKWVDILQKLLEFAKTPDLTPPDIVKHWKDNKHGIVDIIFHGYASELKISPLEETNKLIESNLMFAAKFATVCKDWKKFGVIKLKPVYKEKVRPDLEAISVELFKVPYDSLAYHQLLLVVETYHRRFPAVRIVDATDDI